MTMTTMILMTSNVMVMALRANPSANLIQVQKGLNLKSLSDTDTGDEEGRDEVEQELYFDLLTKAWVVFAISLVGFLNVVFCCTVGVFFSLYFSGSSLLGLFWGLFAVFFRVSHISVVSIYVVFLDVRY